MNVTKHVGRGEVVLTRQGKSKSNIICKITSKKAGKEELRERKKGTKNPQEDASNIAAAKAATSPAL